MNFFCRSLYVRMNKLTALFIAALIIAVTAGDSESNDDFIKEINEAQHLWKATENELTVNGYSKLKNLLGAIVPPHFRIFSNSPLKVGDDIEIPESFDARQKWRECESISSVKDQGYCGSCWAVSAVTSASDRICINSNFRIKVTLSAQHLMSCCASCVQPGKGGCNGGYLIEAWKFFGSHGIVTGGDYQSGIGCQPYAVTPSSQQGYTWWEKVKIFFTQLYEMFFYKPKCYDTCTNNRYQFSFSQDKHYGRTSYVLPEGNEVAIQKDILRYGPSVAIFDVYPDFAHYSSGIYVKTTTKEQVGKHAVRLIGWGVEGGVKYWLAANSWSVYWGDKGTFKIQRGNNECNFESYVTASLPKL